MRRPISTVPLVMVFACLASTARAEWKRHGMWCASDIASADGANIVARLTTQQGAHTRYCNACSSGKDQYEALLECYQGGEDSWARIRGEIEAAGRTVVNEFMSPKAPSCCRKRDEQH